MSKKFAKASRQAIKQIKRGVLKGLKTAKVRKRRRGTAIVETPAGILLVAGKSGRFALPGGGADKQEPREAAAIRELEEETGLKATSVQYLFSYVGGIRQRGLRLVRNHHKVFLIQAEGEPRPTQEIKAIKFYRLGEAGNISASAKEIIKLYMFLKTEQGMAD
jgi:8-oxo-dGTP diphosphatase